MSPPTTSTWRCATPCWSRCRSFPEPWSSCRTTAPCCAAPATASCWLRTASVTPFDGDLDDYAAWLAKNGKARATPDSDRRPRPPLQTRTAAPRRRGTQPAHTPAERAAAYRGPAREARGRAGATRSRARGPRRPTRRNRRRKGGGSRCGMREVVREIGTLEERWLEVMSELEERSA